MTVPFHLRRRPTAEAAVALLWPATEAAALLRHCGRAGIEPAGRAFAVAGGLLLKLDEATAEPVPNALRLRALAPDLLLPVDAELVPALLDDEAAGLVRDRGLVFLPGGRALAFDRRAPLATGFLLTLGPNRSTTAWAPLPEPEPLAESIEQIRVELPGEAPSAPGAEGSDEGDPGPLPESAADAVLETGNESIGSEPARPEPSGPGATLLGNAALNAGRGLMRLGGLLGARGLADLGARLVRGAGALAPRLGESVLGRQAAALQALLREFREGDPERALRRAMPLAGPGESRGGVPDAGDQLPTHDLSYSLGGLLGGGNDGGAARVWLGGRDLMADLAREYRQAAEQALRRGDARRAAYIYAKLLHDYRAAAHALLKGGLHRDAAVIFLAKLGDARAAARAFEAAGEVDRAVALYRRVGEHEAAGDLLRKVGEEDAAIEEYRIAADRLARSAAGPLAAGDLLLNKAGRPDLARAAFAAGWQARPGANAVPCALRIARLDAAAGDVRSLLALVDEADAHFAPPGSDRPAAQFYGEIARLADEPALADARDDLRDRALLGLAAKMRQQAQPGGRASAIVASMVPADPTWGAPLLRDAEFAVDLATKAPPPKAPARAARPAEVTCFGSGQVTAVAASEGAGTILVGFEGGEVYAFRPGSSEVTLIATYDLPVAALASGPSGERVVILRESGGDRGVLSSYARQPDGSYRLMLGTTIDGLQSPWLMPFRGGVEERVGLWDGHDLFLMGVASLTTAARLPLGEAVGGLVQAIPVPLPAGSGPAIVAHDGLRWGVFGPGEGSIKPVPLSWQPAAPGSGLRCPALSWAWSGPHYVELAGLDENGNAHWGALALGTEVRPVLLGFGAASVPEGYRAAALAAPGLVVAVSRSRVDWYRGEARRLSALRSSASDNGHVVAAFVCHESQELILVGAEGGLRRLPLPTQAPWWAGRPATTEARQP